MTKYYKNSDLVRLFSVSDKAVRNWILKSQEGKSKLELVERRGKIYVADTPENNSIIKYLVDTGRKYRNQKTYRATSPTTQFYKQFSSRQALDIANSIEKLNEIPSHYRYFGKGAEYWDDYLNQLYTSDRTNLMNTTHKLLHLDQIYLDMILEAYDHVNVIDIGVGDGLGAKPLLEQLASSNKLLNYVGIDCSPELLELTESNLRKWFGDKFGVQNYIRDITYERFDDVLALNSRKNTLNIVLFLGGTIGNFTYPQQALTVIRDSLGKNDILITSDELDSENARIFNGFRVGVKSEEGVIARNTLLLDLLGIDRSMYDLEQFFDEKLKCRTSQARFKVELTINIELDDYIRSLTIPKGTPIVVFRMWEWTGHELEGMYERCGFTQIRSTKLHHPEFILMLSRVTAGPLTKNPSETI